jgi:hypothetical protein
MDVRYFILARHAEPGTDGSFNALGAGIDTQVVPAFPVHYPVLYAIAKVAFEREDAARDHTLTVNVLDPDGEQIFASQVITQLGQELPPNRETLYMNLFLGFQNIIFKAEGLYTMELLVDGDVAKVLKFRLQSPEMPELPPSTATE